MNEKIIILGAGIYKIYETAIYKALKKGGYENINLFVWKDFLHTSDVNKGVLGLIKLFCIKFQDKFSLGWNIRKYNKFVVKKCEEIKPDLVFIYTGRHVFPKTIKNLRDIGCVIFSYNNDNPFSSYFPKYFWRHYINTLKLVDISYVYRKENLHDSLKSGAKRAELLLPYYIEEDNYVCVEENKIPDVPDVLFLGHNEPDEREEYIKALLDEKIYVGVPENCFAAFETNNKYLVKLKETRNNYNLLLNSTKIALVFLSKINNDKYTRRCFEIPAAGTFMLCPFTEELAELYEENKDVVFYRTKEDFVSLVKYYLLHDEERKKIAKSGENKLLSSGHEVFDRAKVIMKHYNECKSADAK